MQLPASQKRYLTWYTTIFVLAGLWGWISKNDLLLIMVFGAGLIALLVKVLELTAHVQTLAKEKTVKDSYRQTEALFSLFSRFQFRAPLPAMRGWAVSPDFANLIVTEIDRNKPKVILETGSGISSLLIGYCCEALGEGQLIALEHEAKYLEQTQDRLRLHGVQNWVQLRHAPLTPMTIGGETWPWYDLLAVDIATLPQIDMLIVDGPPGTTHPMVRYPALAVLKDKLAPNAVILVDDYCRSDEKKLVARWMEENAGFILETVPTEKETAILRRVGRV